MTLNEFQKECLKIQPKYLTRGDEALLGLIGLNHSAGEAIGEYKKALYGSSELDEKALLDALSMSVVYIATIAHARDVEMISVMKNAVENIERYLAESQKKSDVGDEKD